ncbi:hypothetical protein [Vogesella oryzae]|uniref:hypothetical protein n=1 Tax=Vogesella oryzae TaxID=1735285 RepID=UPI001582E5E0|nr:hypothetical protein [Vogesella oryzae]
MKSHPRNARIKGDPFVPSRFVFGDAVEEQGLEPYEYVIHTEAPTFVCRLVGMDQTPFDGRDKEGFASAVLYDERDNLTHYVTNTGFRLFDFNFWGDIPTAAELHKICDEAMQVYLRLQKAYAEREVAPKERDFRVVPTEPLPPAERQRRIRELADAAAGAPANPLKKMQLPALIQQALLGGDQAVFTEAQLALQSQPEARELLLGMARDNIALPEVMRPDGTVVSYELWAMPLIFSRAHGGFWWHFPLLERVEPALSEALGLPDNTVLWLSPTIFSSDMLIERSCQSLVHLAAVMDAGCDMAPQEVDAARATYQAASKTHEPQLILCWLPFIVERGKLEMERVRSHARKALDAAMPLVQQALASEMMFGEAELFSPLPWWEALAAGVHAYNRKRLGLTVAVAVGVNGKPDGLEAVAEYLPEHQAYDVQLLAQESGKLLGRTPWLLVPDLAPSRIQAWHDLSECLKGADITLREQAPRFH